MQAMDQVEARPGGGLAGDRYDTGLGHWSPIRRSGQGLTLIEGEAIDSLAAADGLVLDAGDTRRNLTTRGIDLDAAIGSRLRIGPVVVKVVRRCEPCSYLDGLLGQPVLERLVHRGGVRVEVETGGVIRVGDAVRIERRADRSQPAACDEADRGLARTRSGRRRRRDRVDGVLRLELHRGEDRREPRVVIDLGDPRAVARQ